jgi:hypothetical protein
MKKSPFHLAIGVGLATGMIGFTPNISEGSVVRADDAATAACKFYSYWQTTGGAVVCWGPAGDACVVCVK